MDSASATKNGSFKRRQDSFKRRQARLIRMRTLQSSGASSTAAASALNHQSSSVINTHTPHNLSSALNLRFSLWFLQVLKSSPSSSEGALTSLRPDLQFKKQFTPQPGVPTVDRFLSHLGNPGRYQVIIMLLLAANCIPVVVNHLLMAFYAVETPHNCRVISPNLFKASSRELEVAGKINDCCGVWQIYMEIIIFIGS